MLQDRVDDHVSSFLSNAQQKVTSYVDGKAEGWPSSSNPLPNTTATQEPSDRSESSSVLKDSAGQKRRHESIASDGNEESEPAESAFPEPLPCSRPSDYLRCRCPLCFGGKFPRPGTMAG